MFLKKQTLGKLFFIKATCTLIFFSLGKSMEIYFVTLSNHRVTMLKLSVSFVDMNNIHQKLFLIRVTSLSSLFQMWANDSLLGSHFYTDPYFCYVTSPGVYILGSFNVTQILVLLPLSIFILNLGFQRLWQTSHSVTASTTSHSDSFTYHMVSIELVGVLSCTVSLYGICIKNDVVVFYCIDVFYFTWYGEIFIHILTCVERYLAVVHPVTYLSLRKEKGIRIRNISIGCVWLFSLIGLSAVIKESYIVSDITLLLFATIIISFCSISVLCVLILPGPGEHGEGRVDQTKQRAFYTIMIILCILVIRLTCSLVWAGLELLHDTNCCLVLLYGFWINLPSSLVLPLLFLLRAKNKLRLK